MHGKSRQHIEAFSRYCRSFTDCRILQLSDRPQLRLHPCIANSRLLPQLALRLDQTGALRVLSQRQCILAGTDCLRDAREATVITDNFQTRDSSVQGRTARSGPPLARVLKRATHVRLLTLAVVQS